MSTAAQVAELIARFGYADEDAVIAAAVDMLHESHCNDDYDDEQITVSAAASAMGRRTSEAKAAAARRNGRKGGRPRKSK